MKTPKNPDASSTDLVFPPVEANTLDRFEVLSEIIRRRLEAALTRLAPGSSRQYGAALANFARWFGRWSVTNTKHLTTFLPMEIIGAQAWWNILAALFRVGPALSNEVVDSYATLGCKTLRPATIAQRLAALRWAFRLGEESGLVTWRLRVRGPRVTPYRDTRGPGLASIQAMLKVVDQLEGTIAARDAVILGVLFILGLRREELATLHVGDFDVERKLLRVVGKGQTDPIFLSVPDALADEIARYLALRGNPSPEQPLLASHDPARKGSGGLTGNGLYRRVLRIAKLAGLSRRVLPHGLRHSAITAALDETNGDLRSVQRFARHAKPETTIKYDDHRRDVAGQIADRLSLIWARSRTRPSKEQRNAHSRALKVTPPNDEEKP